ncbi:hypothetical protein H7I53_23060 [Mycolicibacterium pulveris]|uniref:hypothetical protein n=1 Tax=Mycolicibacterium pulveris TaxID=36813 RepID=UPI0013D2534A|nr:hypothetical protein [Mycolicibacterium pulveris]MCV6983087.1 hypothetical protein [Mycolicibacterium pulveris]
MADFMGSLEIVWPGLSALIGAAIGGGVTLWANKQNSAQERSARKDARQREIKDRGFAACSEVLRTGQLYYNEVNSLWWDLQCLKDRKAILTHDEPFDDALRNHHAATALARIAIPPTAEPSFSDYIRSVRNIANVVADWKVEYLDARDFLSPEPFEFSTSDDSTPEDRYDWLSRDMVTRRDEFARVARELFAEDVWTTT